MADFTAISNKKLLLNRVVYKAKGVKARAKASKAENAKVSLKFSVKCHS